MSYDNKSIILSCTNRGFKESCHNFSKLVKTNYFGVPPVIFLPVSSSDSNKRNSKSSSESDCSTGSGRLSARQYTSCVAIRASAAVGNAGPAVKLVS